MCMRGNKETVRECKFISMAAIIPHLYTHDDHSTNTDNYQELLNITTVEGGLLRHTPSFPC